MSHPADHCARELMETVPQIMQAIRVEMRIGHGANISIPQFRALRFIQRHPNSALTDVADYLGLTSPSVSKLVDGLVKQELVNRRESSTDRRRITLELTTTGQTIVNMSRTSAQANLAQTLASLSKSELEVVMLAMHLLDPLFVKPSVGKE